MRIEFPHSDREDFLWTGSRLRIGSGADNDLRLPADAAAEHHAVIRAEPAIGLVLDVVAGADRVYVNARPVRERAMLRHGDILGLGRSRLLLCADPASTLEAVKDADAGVIGVRAVAGPLSGKVWSLTRQLRFGGGGIALPMPSGESVAFDFERGPQGLRLLATAPSSRFPLRVNGRVVSLPHALQAGDQVGLGMHRFIVEAPGLLADRVEAHVPPPPPVPAEPAPAARGEIWWLILTAAILALGISLVLWIHR